MLPNGRRGPGAEKGGPCTGFSNASGCVESRPPQPRLDRGSAAAPPPRRELKGVPRPRAASSPANARSWCVVAPEQRGRRPLGLHRIENMKVVVLYTFIDFFTNDNIHYVTSISTTLRICERTYVLPGTLRIRCQGCPRPAPPRLEAPAMRQGPQERPFPRLKRFPRRRPPWPRR